MGRRRRPDIIILTSAFILILIGILTVSSTSYAIGEKSKINFDKRHVFLSIISIIILVSSLFIDFKTFFKNHYLIIFYIIFLLLLIGLFFQEEIKETHRFYRVFNFLFQPSEFLKIFIVILTAKIITAYPYPNFLIYTLILCFPLVLLVMLEPDLGMSVLIMSTIFFMIYIKGIKINAILITIFIFFSIIMFSISISPYQINRILEFAEGKCEHQITSKIAIGSGGLFGKGIGKSHQKFFYLSMPHTDFAFSIISEETGFFGSLILIGCYFAIFLRGFYISNQIEDLFIKFVMLGLVILFTLNALIHISVNIGIIPAKGTTLPMVSYGGSSLISNSILLGIVLSISMREI